jgi:hypothetical protein
MIRLQDFKRLLGSCLPIHFLEHLIWTEQMQKNLRTCAITAILLFLIHHLRLDCRKPGLLAQPAANSIVIRPLLKVRLN